MVEVKFKNRKILNTIFLLSAFYAFDAEYPKESTGHSKNIQYSCFLNIQGRLQEHSLAIVYRNQWLNWFP